MELVKYEQDLRLNVGKTVSVEVAIEFSFNLHLIGCVGGLSFQTNDGVKRGNPGLILKHDENLPVTSAVIGTIHLYGKRRREYDEEINN